MQRLRHPPQRSKSSQNPRAAQGNSAEPSARVYLEIARLFVAYGKTGFARRRLKMVIDRWGDSPAALESRMLLASIDDESGLAVSTSAAE